MLRHPQNLKRCVKLQLHHKLLAHYNKDKRILPPFCFWHFEGEKQKIGKAMGQIRIQHLKIVLKSENRSMAYSTLKCLDKFNIPQNGPD